MALLAVKHSELVVVDLTSANVPFVPKRWTRTSTVPAFRETCDFA
jgi:hypothetical protein